MEIYTLVIGDCATNVYIIIENGEAVVIDPADRADKILDFIKHKSATLKYVLLTHGHFDHIGAVGELQQCGAVVIMSETDYTLVKNGKLNGMFDVSVKNFDLDKSVLQNDVAELIGHKFNVIATAGHTPGSVCYVLDDDIIFSGDTLFCLSIGRTDFAFGDKSDLLSSVKKLYALPHDYKVLPGHGQPTTLEFERKNNPYVKL